MALGLTQMVLDVQKNFKPTQFYMPNIFCFNIFPKKLIPGDVRAQVLQEPVGGSHADQGRQCDQILKFQPTQIWRQNDTKRHP